MAHGICSAISAASRVPHGRLRALNSLGSPYVTPGLSARPLSQFHCVCHSATGSAAQPTPEEFDQQQKLDAGFQDSLTLAATTSSSQQAPKGIVQRIKRFFGGDKMDMQRLRALGLGAVASYGCVSNLTYGTGLAISWITFVHRTGLKGREWCKLRSCLCLRQTTYIFWFVCLQVSPH